MADRRSRITIIGDASSLLRAIKQSQTAVALFQKQLQQSGVMAAQTPLTKRQMQQAQRDYIANMKAAAAEGEKVKTQAVARGAQAQATITKQSLKDQEATARSHLQQLGREVGGFRVTPLKGPSLLAGTLEEAEQLAKKTQGTFGPLTKGMKDWIVESKTGERAFVGVGRQAEKMAKETADRIGGAARQLSFGAANVSSTTKGMTAAAIEAQRTAATSATRTAQGYEHLGNAVQLTQRHFDEAAKAQGRNTFQLGRGIRATLAGAGAFSQLGRSIAYASATFLAFAVFSGVVRTAVSAAAQFQLALSHIVGLAGGARKQVEGFGQAILRLAPSVGTGPQELADALYFIASAGIRANKQMATLHDVALASAAGLGETQVVADAVTSAMNAYGQSTMSAAKATNVLVDTVHYGKGEASTFAPVLGTVASYAAALGIKFYEVGAALAEMTRLGKPAQTAAIELQAFFSNMLRPTVQAQAAMLRLGKQAGITNLSFEGLIGQLKTKGLLSVLQTLNRVFHGNADLLTQVFTNVRAVRGVLALVGKSAQDTYMVFRKMAGSTNALSVAFGAVSKDPAFRFKAFQATMQSLSIVIGSALLPSVVAVGDAVGKWLGKKKNVDELNNSIKTIVESIGDLVKVLKQLVGLFTPILNMAARMTGGWGAFLKALTIGWVMIHVRNKALAAAMARDQEGAASRSSVAWTNASRQIGQAFRTIRGLTPIASARQAFTTSREAMARRADLARRAVPVTLLRQPRGAIGAPMRGAAGFMGERDIFRPGGPGTQPFAEARKVGLPGGARLVPIRFVTEPGPLRNMNKLVVAQSRSMAASVTKAYGSAIAAVNQQLARVDQYWMRQQQRLNRAAPRLGGLLNRVIGTPTRQRGPGGQITSLMQREGGGLSGIMFNAQQDLMVAQQRLSRRAPRLGGFVNALFGTPTRMQAESGRYTALLRRQNRTTLGMFSAGLNQDLMRAQQRLSRISPGIGGFINALFGTPTRQQNQLGQATTLLRRQGRVTFGQVAADLNQASMRAQQRLSRQVPFVGRMMSTIFGTATRQQDAAGRFTSQLRRQGSAIGSAVNSLTSGLARVRPGTTSLVNAVFGTPTQQRNEMGRYTDQFKRQGGIALTKAANDLNQSSMRLQQRLSRQRGGGLFNAILGTPTRQQDAAGRATRQLARQGGAISGAVSAVSAGATSFTSVWSKAITGVSAMFTRMGASFRTTTMAAQISPGPLRVGMAKAAASMRTSMVGVARAGGVAFEQMFIGVRAAATAAATTTRAVFTAAFVSIGVVAREVLIMTGWGIIAVLAGQAAVEVMNHWKQVKAYFALMWKWIVASAKTAWAGIVGSAKVAFGILLTYITAPIRALLELLSHLPLIGDRFKGALASVRSATTGLIRGGLADIAGSSKNWGVKAKENFIAGFKSVPMPVLTPKVGPPVKVKYGTEQTPAGQSVIPAGHFESRQALQRQILTSRRQLTQGNTRDLDVGVRAALFQQAAAKFGPFFGFSKVLGQVKSDMRSVGSETKGMVDQTADFDRVMASLAKSTGQGWSEQNIALAKTMILSGKVTDQSRDAAEKFARKLDELAKKQQQEHPFLARNIAAVAAFTREIGRLPTEKEINLILTIPATGRTQIQTMLQEAIRTGVITVTQGGQMMGEALVNGLSKAVIRNIVVAQRAGETLAQAAADAFRHRTGREGAATAVTPPARQPVAGSAQARRAARDASIIGQYGLGFVPGTTQQFALPPSLTLKQAQAAAFGTAKDQEKVNASIRQYLKALLRTRGLTDQQRTAVLTMYGSLRADKTASFAVSVGLQLREARASLSGSAREMEQTEIAIRNWILTQIKAGKHTKDWLVAATQALKQANDAIAAAQTELPVGLQLQAAKATTKQQQIASQRAIRDYYQGLIDSGKLGDKALIDAYTQRNQAQQQLQTLLAQQFQIPVALQIQEAKAAASGSEKQQKAVNAKVVAWIKQQIREGKFHGDSLVAAYQELGNRINKAVTGQADLIKTATDTISGALDTARSTIGSLFQGPILNPTDAQKGMTIGLKGPNLPDMTKDVGAQADAATKFFDGIQTMAKRLKRFLPKNVVQDFVKEFTQMGPEAMPYLSALLGASDQALAKFAAAYKKRDLAAGKIARINLQSEKVDLTAKQMVLKLTPAQVKTLANTGQLVPLPAAPGGQRGRGAVANVPSSIGSLVRRVGGVTPGSGGGDTVPAMLTPGEVVFNAKQQGKLARQLGIAGAGPHQLFAHVQSLPGRVRGFQHGGVATPARLREAGVPPSFRSLSPQEKRRRIVLGYERGRMSYEQALKALRFWHLGGPISAPGPRAQQRSSRGGMALPISPEDIVRFNIQQMRPSARERSRLLSVFKGLVPRTFLGMGPGDWASLFIPVGGLGKAGAVGAVAKPGMVRAGNLKVGQEVFYNGEWRGIGGVRKVFNEAGKPVGVSIIPEKGPAPGFNLPFNDMFMVRARTRTAATVERTRGRGAGIETPARWAAALAKGFKAARTDTGVRINPVRARAFKAFTIPWNELKMLKPRVRTQIMHNIELQRVPRAWQQGLSGGFKAMRTTSGIVVNPAHGRSFTIPFNKLGDLGAAQLARLMRSVAPKPVKSLPDAWLRVLEGEGEGHVPAAGAYKAVRSAAGITVRPRRGSPFTVGWAQLKMLRPGAMQELLSRAQAPPAPAQAERGQAVLAENLTPGQVVRWQDKWQEIAHVNRTRQGIRIEPNQGKPFTIPWSQRWAFVRGKQAGERSPVGERGLPYHRAFAGQVKKGDSVFWKGKWHEILGQPQRVRGGMRFTDKEGPFTVPLRESLRVHRPTPARTPVPRGFNPRAPVRPNRTPTTMGEIRAEKDYWRRRKQQIDASITRSTEPKTVRGRTKIVPRKGLEQHVKFLRRAYAVASRQFDKWDQVLRQKKTLVPTAFHELRARQSIHAATVKATVDDMDRKITVMNKIGGLMASPLWGRYVPMLHGHGTFFQQGPYAARVRSRVATLQKELGLSSSLLNRLGDIPSSVVKNVGGVPTRVYAGEFNFAHLRDRMNAAQAVEKVQAMMDNMLFVRDSYLEKEKGKLNQMEMNKLKALYKAEGRDLPALLGGRKIGRGKGYREVWNPDTKRYERVKNVADIPKDLLPQTKMKDLKARAAAEWRMVRGQERWSAWKSKLDVGSRVVLWQNNSVSKHGEVTAMKPVKDPQSLEVRWDGADKSSKIPDPAPIIRLEKGPYTKFEAMGGPQAEKAATAAGYVKRKDIAGHVKPGDLMLMKGEWQKVEDSILRNNGMQYIRFQGRRQGAEWYPGTPVQVRSIPVAPHVEKVHTHVLAKALKEGWKIFRENEWQRIQHKADTDKGVRITTVGGDVFTWKPDSFHKAKYAMGGVIPRGSIEPLKKMATGGIVTKPTLALIGEKGPEAVIPMQKGGVAASKVVSGSGGFSDVTSSTSQMIKANKVLVQGNNVTNRITVNPEINVYVNGVKTKADIRVRGSVTQRRGGAKRRDVPESIGAWAND